MKVWLYVVVIDVAVTAANAAICIIKLFFFFCFSVAFKYNCLQFGNNLTKGLMNQSSHEAY